MLNLRHKLALSATVVCVGLMLLGGAVRTAVSIGLIGVAFSWAFGSTYRLVHWLCVIVGLLLLSSAAGDGFVWRKYKQPSLIQDQLAMIENDRSLLKDEESDIRRETDRQKYHRDLSEYAKDLQELARLKGETAFHHVMSIEWQTIVGGMLLLSAGLGGRALISIRRALPSLLKQ